MDKRITEHIQMKEETSSGLGALAGELNYFVRFRSRHYGKPAKGELLDALITAYRTNPTAVTDALRALGIEGEGPPSASG